jgi:hypothetical protein
MPESGRSLDRFHFFEACEKAQGSQPLGFSFALPAAENAAILLAKRIL